MGNYLSDRRKELGLLQSDVAKAVGVSDPTVSRWESGDIANMRRDKIEALAKVLRTDPYFIMTGEHAEKEKPAELIGELSEVEIAAIKAMRSMTPAELSMAKRMLGIDD